MTNTPYSYQPSLLVVTSPLAVVYAGSHTNTGSSGGQYESIEGWRVIVRNRSVDPIYMTYGPVIGGDYSGIAPLTFPIEAADGISYTTYILEPGGWTEYGVTPQAAEGLSNDGAGLKATGWSVPVLVSLEKPALVEAVSIQTDPLPVLSY